VAASFLVKRALFIAPLWLGVLVLSLLHLKAARRESACMEPRSGLGSRKASPPLPPQESSSDGVYI
jgi:hypothetical protein